jgi:Bacterial Ig domain
MTVGKTTIRGLDRNPGANQSVGQVFAFQLPVGSVDFKVTTVGGERDFVSPNPPIITNKGFSMYWSVSGSELRSWVGVQGSENWDFNTDGAETAFFDWGDPAWAAAAAPPTLSSDPLTPFVVGPTAANQLFRSYYDSSNSETTTIYTSLPVQNRVLISRDDLRVYYTTPAPDGNLYSIDSSSLLPYWNISISAVVVGEIAISLNGDKVYVADALGGVTAFVVADVYKSTFAPASFIAPPVALVAPSPPPTVTTEYPVSPTPSVMKALGNLAFETAMNTPLQIPSPASSGETMRVLNWPLRGNLTINSDGSITYVPRTGFAGANSFNLEICDTVDQSCRVERISVFVTADKTSSNRWYLLSLLALVPIGILAVLCYKRLGTETNPKVESTPSDCPRDEADDHVDNREEEVFSTAAPVPAVARMTDANRNVVRRQAVGPTTGFPTTCGGDGAVGH